MPEQSAAKRMCVRPSQEGDEHSEDLIKNSKYNIVDLDGFEHPTRFKENLASGETDLRFLSRT